MSIKMGTSRMDLGDFLAHHGIKGMRWGVRRDRSTSSGGGSKKSSSEAGDDGLESKAARRAGEGSVSTVTRPDGTTKTMIKKDGKWVETHLSVDAERTAKTMGKQSHEMSDREIKEAVNRANSIRDYNKQFGLDPNAELQNKVNELNLKKQYSQLKAEMNPTRMQKVSALAGRAGNTWKLYQEIDNKFGGALTNEIKKNLGNKAAGGMGKGKGTKGGPPPAPWTKPKVAAGSRPVNSGPRPATFKPNPSFRPGSRGPTNPVFNVTNVGRQASSGFNPGKNYPNPFTPSLTVGRPYMRINNDGSATPMDGNGNPVRK